VFLPLRVPRLTAGAMFYRPSGAGRVGRQGRAIYLLRFPRLAAGATLYRPSGAGQVVERGSGGSLVTLPQAGGWGYVLAALRGWVGGEAFVLGTCVASPQAGG